MLPEPSSFRLALDRALERTSRGGFQFFQIFVDYAVNGAGRYHCLSDSLHSKRGSGDPKKFPLGFVDEV